MIEERADSPTPTESDATTAPLSGDDITSLVDVMRSMMRDCVEKRRCYEEETERRAHDMSKCMELLEQLLKDKPDKDSKKDKDPIKLTRLSDSDDIESYVTTLERLMKVYEIDSARWAYKLAPQLTGRARQAYAALNPDEAQSYDAVKAAKLRQNNINEETYRKRFRSLKHKSGQAPTELVIRLSDLASEWVKMPLTIPLWQTQSCCCVLA